jgi:hypothetical protein
MPSDDTFAHGLHATIEGLRYWVPSIADLAHISQSETPDGWTLNVKPKVGGACPFELRLRRDGAYDIALAGQAYPARAVESLTMFEPLINSIIDGRVVQRHWISSQTGAARAIETLITLPNGRVWRDGDIAPAGCETRDRHFLPYRR